MAIKKPVSAVFGKTLVLQKGDAPADDIYIFEGVASVEGVVDRAGERFERGAFAESIGKTVPIQVMHGGIWTIIGTGVISKTGDTIFIKGKLFDDVEAARAIAKAKDAGVQFNLSIGGRRQEYAWVREDEVSILSTRKATITEVSFTGEGQQAHPDAVVTKTDNKIGEDNDMDAMEKALKELGEKVAGIETSIEKALKDGADAGIEAVKTELAGISKALGELKPTEDVAKATELGALKDVVAAIEKTVNAIQMPKAGEPGSNLEKALADSRAAVTTFVKDGHYDYRKAGETLEKVDEAYVKGLNTDNTSAGYTIPQSLEREIIKEMSDASPLFSDAKVYMSTSKALTVPVRVKGANSAKSVAEGAAGVDGDVTYSALELEAGIIQSQIPITDECREDSAFDLSAEIEEVISEDMSDTLNERIIAGVLSATQKFEGFTVNATVVANAQTSGVTGEFGHDDLVDLEMSVRKRDRKNGKYYASTSAVAVMKKLRDSAGKPYWYESVSKAVPPTYNGYPVEEVAEMDDVAADKYPVLFANFAEFYAVLRRKGLSMEIERDAKKREDTVIANARLGGKVRRASCGKLLKIKA